MRRNFSVALTAMSVFYLVGINGHPAQTQPSAQQQTPLMGADNQQCPKLKTLKFQGESPLDQVCIDFTYVSSASFLIIRSILCTLLPAESDLIIAGYQDQENL
jgi:hypothetical protein